ncbi:unnamed protein product [Brugia pahangi]|uniref:Uncharacterized protein n=1 Tax=Brugia pahangi TaxID=6280 RepID=A0A0N4TM28_BRUPA|nr:unnamed protein product [Brugia pahangi]
MSIRNCRTFPAPHNFHYCVDDSSSIVCIRITSAAVILCDTTAETLTIFFLFSISAFTFTVRTNNFLLRALNSCAKSSAYSATTSSMLFDRYISRLIDYK